MRALFGRTAARQQQQRIAVGGSSCAAVLSGVGAMRASGGARAAAAPAADAAPAATEPAPAADRGTAASLSGQHENRPTALPHYADYPIDRASDLRADPSALSALFSAPQARLLPVLAPSADGAARVLAVAAAPKQAAGPPPSSSSSSSYPLAPAWVRPAAAVSGALADGGGLPGCVFLGVDADGAGVFAGRVRPDAADAVVAEAQQQQQQQQAAAAAADAPPPSWVAARTAGPDMSPGDAALVATAAGVASWHAAAQYDGGSGLPTLPRRGGHSRGVDAAAANPTTTTVSRPPRALYPRVDPATIMLVREGAWALLGRKAEWPTGRWSTLAGFVECGETFEQCVARETLEESGVRVRGGDVRYVESQPWPFPRSLMVGFYASPELDDDDGDASKDEDPYSLLPPGAARRAAVDVGITGDELRRYLLPRLPPARPATGELEDCRWFFRGWIRRALRRHAQQVAEEEEEGASPQAQALFHVPGHYSLGNRLVHGWLAEQGAGAEDEDEDEDKGGESEGSSGDPLARFPSVDVGGPGETFKYVLLRVFEEASGRSMLAVHGHPAAEYHDHVLQRAKARAAALGLSAAAVQVLGGGRIRRGGEDGSIFVYGYSAAFGSSPHEVSAAILRRWFPFSDVTVSYGGY